jgi:geranylgeranyl diphosphate synthase type II
MDGLAEYSKYIEKELSKIHFPPKPHNLYDPLTYFLKLGGKRLRPVLTLLASEMYGKNRDEALSAALAVEVFHNFTLIHDDIMDQAPLRRNKETIQVKWNANIAILSGDVLFVKAYQLLVKQDEKHLKELIDVFNRTAIEVCEGQQLDMDFEDRSNVTVEEYIEMIRLKTSVLLGCALEFGAIIADAPKDDRYNLYQFGQNIGIAFQIQDDILDLYADPEKFGKQVGGDVISDKKTLLNLKALELSDEKTRNQLTDLQNETDAERKVAITRLIYDNLKVKSVCEEIMEHYYNQAMFHLKQIEKDENSKERLTGLARFLMTRST